MMFDDDIYTDAKGPEWCCCVPQKERLDPSAHYECPDCLGLVPIANLNRRYGNVHCQCELQELPQNPERRCSRCGDFIAISDADNGDDWDAFVESMRIPEAERRPRCAKCWKGAGCKCSEPELVRDVLARVMPVHMAAVGGEDLRRRK